MMSENSEIWNLNALCRCCHSDGYFKNLQGSYVYDNEIEIYSKMLRDAINVEIRPPPVDASYTICDVCILRLREACQFKKQVLLCERKFEEYIKNELAGSVGNDDIKLEADDEHYDQGGFDDYDHRHTLEIEVKCDNVFTKKEEKDYDLSYSKEIKCEDESKNMLGIVPEVKIKNDSKHGKTELKKKEVRKKPKTERRYKKTYDPSLEVHVTTESGVLYSCKVCGGGYPDQKRLRKHIETSHMEGKFKCFYCDERFRTPGKRNEHIRTHSECALKCSYCEKVFFSRNARKEHENSHTRAKIFTCDFCAKSFAYKSTLKTHLRGHYGTKKQCMCHLCGNGFNDKANLNAHIRTVHEKQRPYACELCPKTFTANKHLKVHIRKHTGEQPYACDQCPKKFFCTSALANHKVSHMDKTYRYVCKVCRKRFTDRTLFVKHIRKSHIGQRPFKCSICDKDFICKYSMKRHEIEHSGIKPFECDQCGAKFSQKGAMNRHVDRKHGIPKEGVTEKCEICNKLVTDLKRHMLCHNNKRFSCEYCDKSYSENNVLTRHKKVVHFGIKPHVCEYCDKKYVKVNSLKNHQLKVHKIVSKIETDEDFDSAVAKFSIKNKKGKIKTEGMAEDGQTFGNPS